VTEVDHLDHEAIIAIVPEAGRRASGLQLRPLEG
jgi:hypothetical protein